MTGHSPLPIFPQSIASDSIWGRSAEVIYNNIISGPAAVIVFFVISGLCIHYPSSVSLKIDGLGRFYARRFIRIVLPIFAALLISRYAFNYQFGRYEHTILWSLFCELIYYAIYPLLLVVRRRAGGWLPLIIAAFVAAILVILSAPETKNYPTFGLSLTWIVGLPSWLIGCQLGEAIHKQRFVVSRQKIWTVRALILGLSMVSSALRFHSPVGYPWTLNLFSIAIFYWLALEIAHFRTHKAPPVLEWAGSWSYSLYLIHAPLIFIFPILADGSVTHTVSWMIMIATILSISYVFALVVEFPSHRFARIMADKIHRPFWRKPPDVPVERGVGSS